MQKGKEISKKKYGMAHEHTYSPTFHYIGLWQWWWHMPKPTMLKAYNIKFIRCSAVFFLTKKNSRHHNETLLEVIWLDLKHKQTLLHAHRARTHNTFFERVEYSGSGSG